MMEYCEACGAKYKRSSYWVRGVANKSTTSDILVEGTESRIPEDQCPMCGTHESYKAPKEPGPM